MDCVPFRKLVVPHRGTDRPTPTIIHPHHGSRRCPYDELPMERYGYDITPIAIVIKLPILYFNTVGQFYWALDLHRWPAYDICIVILHLFCVLLLYLVHRLPFICQNCAILLHIPERNIIRSLGVIS